jgi:hypothetical protein
MKSKKLRAAFAAFFVCVAHHASGSSVTFVGIDSPGPTHRCDVHRVAKTLPELRALLAILDAVRLAGVRRVMLRATSDFGPLRYWLVEFPERPEGTAEYSARMTKDSDFPQ